MKASRNALQASNNEHLKQEDPEDVATRARRLQRGQGRIDSVTVKRFVYTRKAST